MMRELVADFDWESLTADEVVARAVELFGDGLTMACSFQKEESVLVDMLVAANPDARAFTIDTGVLFPETLAAWRAFEDRYGIRFEVHEAKRAGGPWTGPDDCCSGEKVAALERALDGADAWITGVRREQSPTRAGAAKVEWDANRRIWKVNPLADWSERDLWIRISERDLPYHELHDRGYASIGCACCTRPGSGREGRWAGSERTECGLHVAEGEVA